jgi:carbon-monoxide dehydrogenase iron sulfur subunit
MMRISVDVNKCTGCRTCEIVCSMVKNGLINRRRARIRVHRDEMTGLDMPVFCIQCTDAACMQACPNSALSQDDVSGIIRVDAEECTGCGQCADACPIGAIVIDRDTEVPLICDLCGGEPQCVAWCPGGALILSEDTPGLDYYVKELHGIPEKRIDKWRRWAAALVIS